MSTLKLYGVDVQVGDYENLKQLANALFMVTPANEPKARARKRCVYAAARFLHEFRGE